MKNYFSLISIIMIAFLMTLILPSHSNASETKEVNASMENYLKNNVHYYHDQSMKITDQIELSGKVTKIIKTDDPKTEANEEKIEEYQSNLIVAFVEYELVRDSIFFFTKKDYIFYDADRDEFLLSGHVLGNAEVKTFFNKHVSEVGKKLNAFSQVLITALFLLSFLIVIIVMLVTEAKHKVTSYSYYQRYSTTKSKYS
ncbi:hypothetical protein ACFSO7_21225 [Bacillus sp. CGMCC 1.16607]|uniref:hypothetical protein n=1 Tax=Bacillus sp. CGMCC 1.16607 TaxID=3351842 RepID=UPI0036322C4E